MLRLLMVFILIGLIFDRYSKENNLKNVSFKREVETSVVEIDETFNVKIVVENKKWLPVSFLQIKEAFPMDLEFSLKANVEINYMQKIHTMTMALMPFQRITRIYQMIGLKRGKHIFQEISFISGDFIGLKTYSEPYSNGYRQEIVVLPKPYSSLNDLKPYSNYYGDISVKRWIIDDPIMIRGVREYTGNEAEKYIHWPTTLKNGKLMVKDFDFTSDHSAIIILNTEVNLYLWENKDLPKIEACFSLTRTVLEAFEVEGIPYGLASNVTGITNFLGRSITDIGYGSHHLHLLLESLGRADY
ncbi:MAG: DUF58 domain-containing protein, partial [Eubacteriales bacterium]|nr:DUF58 domain-containing protein [Eubacteriales bacterium]